MGATLLRLAQSTNKGDVMSMNIGTNIVSVVFTDVDVKKTMPHLKGISNAVALESIRELFESYLREAGHEIMWQLLNDNGWNIGGQNFIDDGGW